MAMQHGVTLPVALMMGTVRATVKEKDERDRERAAQNEIKS